MKSRFCNRILFSEALSKTCIGPDSALKCRTNPLPFSAAPGAVLAMKSAPPSEVS